MCSRQCEAALRIMLEVYEIPSVWRVALGTTGRSVHRKLGLMDIGVAINAYCCCSFVSNRCVKRIRFVTARTRRRCMFPLKVESGYTVVEYTDPPAVGHMTSRATVPFHRGRELSPMSIFVARLAPDDIESEDKLFIPDMTRPAGDGRMSSRYIESGVPMPDERKSGWAESLLGMTPGAVVGVPLREFAPVFVLVAGDACCCRFHCLLALLRIMALPAFHGRVLAPQRKRRQGMIELLPRQHPPCLRRVTGRTGIFGECRRVRR